MTFNSNRKTDSENASPHPINDPATESFRKEFRELVQDQKNLDFRVNNWAKRVVQHYRTRTRFDQFVTDSLGESKPFASELWRRAQLAKTNAFTPDSWQEFGGFAAIDRALSPLFSKDGLIDRGKVVNAVQTAQAKKLRRLNTVVTESAQPQAKKISRTPEKPNQKLSHAAELAKAFRKYVEGSGIKVPANIWAIVDIYDPK
jgi:hypothetical protein